MVEKGLHAQFRGETIYGEHAVVGKKANGSTPPAAFVSDDYVQVKNTPLLKIYGVWLATDIDRSGTNHITHDSGKTYKLIERNLSTANASTRKFGWIQLNTTVADDVEVMIDYQTEQKNIPVSATFDRRLNVSLADPTYGETFYDDWGAEEDPIDITSPYTAPVDFIQLSPEEASQIEITTIGYRIDTVAVVDFVFYRNDTGHPKDVIAQITNATETDGSAGDGINIILFENVFAELDEPGKIYFKHRIVSGSLGSDAYITIRARSRRD